MLGSPEYIEVSRKIFGYHFLRPPVVSWGVMLQQAQNVRTISLHPWLLIPGLFVVLVVLCFNFVGDGVRAAADSYSR